MTDGDPISPEPGTTPDPEPTETLPPETDTGTAEDPQKGYSDTQGTTEGGEGEGSSA